MIPRQRHALLACLLATLAGCGPADQDPRLNVLLVVIDTARADKFGCYGNGAGLTPQIDRLAAAGVLFEEAIAHAPWTLPSTASLLTSQYPPQHGAGGFVDLRPADQGGQGISFHALPEAAETLAEVLQAGGWRTGAVINVDFLDKPFGLTQGVDDLDARWYGSNQAVRSATETTDKALEWVEQQTDHPFFLLAHYFDAHAVYNPPPEFRRRFALPVDRESSNFSFGTRAHMALLRSGKLELDPALIERAEALYEAELAYIDSQVGRLLDGLARAGLADNTLVVLTADHGEEFLDHGGFEHGHTLYEELLRVPLIFRLPGQIEAGGRYASPVGLVDVAPTICEILNLDVPPCFVGETLRRALTQGSLAPQPVLSHGNFWGEPLVSWRVDNWKLILTPDEPGGSAVELYDLDADPGEQRDLSQSKPLVRERLLLGLKLARARIVAAKAGADLQLDAASRARLEALGYLEAHHAGEQANPGDAQ